jgi:hypothetical protein
MPSITVKDSANADQTVQTLPAVGQGTMAASLPVCIASNQSSIPVTVGNASLAVTGPLTDTQLRASAVNVTVSNASVPVTGTFWQATQPVSGPLTDTQLRATAVPVSGPLTDTQLRATAVPVSGTVAVSGTIPVSGTFWQATQPVSGPLTDTQLRASAVPVSLASLPSVDLLSKNAESSATFTRPADTVAYASGDLVGNSTTAASVTRMNFTTATRVAAGTATIRRARIKKSTNVVTGASFRLHIFKADPGTLGVGDNVAMGTTAIPLANWMGAMDCTMTQQGSDGAKGIAVPVEGAEINFKLASGQTIYGVLEARGAYTPGSAEVFIVDLELLQD